MDIESEFLKQYTKELLANKNEWLSEGINEKPETLYFMSNDVLTMNCFERLYEYCLHPNTQVNRLIITTVLKELILRIYNTDGRYLLFDIFGDQKAMAELNSTILYIQSNIGRAISIEELCNASGLGKKHLV